VVERRCCSPVGKDKFYAQVDLTKEVLFVPFTKTDEDRVKCLAGLVDQLLAATDILQGL
jgi:hypothetical protein